MVDNDMEKDTENLPVFMRYLDMTVCCFFLVLLVTTL